MSDQTTPGTEPAQGEPDAAARAAAAAARKAEIEAAGASAAEAVVSSDPKSKHPVFEHAESVAKLATVVLGGLYVLGVLISNIQLMELGISDFASLLQTRNILTGFFFVVY